MTRPTEDRLARILVVDDNEAIHLDFRKVLSDAGGSASADLDTLESSLFGEETGESPVGPSFELSMATQGQEGVALAEAARAEGRPFAVAFVDMRMPPGWDGLETIQKLWEVDADVQVVICSAYSDYSWQEIHDRLGPTDQLLLLKKPFDVEEVRQLAGSLAQKWRFAAETRRRIKDLEELNVELRKSRDETHEAMRVKSEFLANMSHEIRTPLNGVVGLIDLISDPADETERLECLEMLKHCVDHLRTLLDDILGLSQLESGNAVLSCEPFDLTSLQEGPLAGLASLARKKGISFSCEIEDEGHRVILGDAFRVRQILVNLTANAIKFTAQGRIGIKLSVKLATNESALLRAEISDTGIGIKPERLGAIFESFVQEDGSTTRHYGGTGLGLSISQRIVDLMGGELGVESELGRGSTFWFEIPIAIAATDSCGPVATASSAAGTTGDSSARSGDGSGSGDRRALVVDDNKANQLLARKFLERLGFAVDVAGDGRQGFEKAAAEDFDVILMDYHMPVLDGLESARLIRGLDSDRGRVPIIALTADTEIESQDDFDSSGIQSVLFKPIDGTELGAALRRTLG